MPADDQIDRQSFSDDASDAPDLCLDMIADELDDVRQCISQRLTSSSGGVGGMLSHVADGRGKMLRPAMVLLAGKCCGGVTKKHIEIAAMVELVHIATLLHDDVIDEARSRRGAETVNARWGDKAAVVLGMLLLDKVFSMGTGLDMPEISRELSMAAIRVCEGEMGQNLLKNSWVVNEKEYIAIVRDKTASLFGSCSYLGGLAGGADTETLEQLREFGICLGIAFQITDDLLDITGDEDDMGKTLGSDLAKRRMTLPMIHFLARSNESDRPGVVEELSTISRDRLVDILRDAGSYDHACSAAKDYGRRACKAITSLCDSDAKQALLSIADYAASRVA